jgi:AbiV family abortive infection protein
MRGRHLYLHLAEKCYANAVVHFHDARALRRRGSRGHACSLAVLSVEESAKAVLYKLAGEGVYRIVSKKPNGISTYSESQLFDHKFKHAIVARLIYQGILSWPVQRVLAKTRKKTFTRRQVEPMLLDLLHEQEMQSIALRSNDRAFGSVKHIFELLEGSNSQKNSGFYVGHKSGRPVEPNDLPKKTLDEFVELAGVTLDKVGPLISEKLRPEVQRQVALSVREVAKAMKLKGG